MSEKDRKKQVTSFLRPVNQYGYIKAKKEKIERKTEKKKREKKSKQQKRNARFRVYRTRADKAKARIGTWSFRISPAYQKSNPEIASCQLHVEKQA